MHRWRQFLTDCNQFLSAHGFAERAAAKGWDALALFGLRPSSSSGASCCEADGIGAAGHRGLPTPLRGS